MGRIVALDIGDVRVGVAMSDELRIIASPHSVLSRDENTIDSILNIIVSNGVDLIVCGLPLSLSSAENEQSEKTRRFVELLRAKTSVQIVMQDERMTSVAAERVLIDGNVRREKRKGIIDKIAATLILESYMNRYCK